MRYFKALLVAFCCLLLTVQRHLALMPSKNRRGCDSSVRTSSTMLTLLQNNHIINVSNAWDRKNNHQSYRYHCSNSIYSLIKHRKCVIDGLYSSRNDLGVATGKRDAKVRASTNHFLWIINIIAFLFFKLVAA